MRCASTASFPSRFLPLRGRGRVALLPLVLVLAHLSSCASEGTRGAELQTKGTGGQCKDNNAPAAYLLGGALLSPRAVAMVMQLLRHYPEVHVIDKDDERRAADGLGLVYLRTYFGAQPAPAAVESWCRRPFGFSDAVHPEPLPLLFEPSATKRRASFPLLSGAGSQSYEVYDMLPTMSGYREALQQLAETSGKELRFHYGKSAADFKGTYLKHKRIENGLVLVIAPNPAWLETSNTGGKNRSLFKDLDEILGQGAEAFIASESPPELFSDLLPTLAVNLRIAEVFTRQEGWDEEGVFYPRTLAIAADGRRYRPELFADSAYFYDHRSPDPHTGFRTTALWIWRVERPSSP